MTAKELAAILNGREVGGELFPEEERNAKDAGLVVVFSYSDDNMEFRGFINEEAEAYDGRIIYVNRNGILKYPDCKAYQQEDCPYYNNAKATAKTVKAVCHDNGGPCWTYETDIPHETFSIYEAGELFCVGIVFSMEYLET